MIFLRARRPGGGCRQTVSAYIGEVPHEVENSGGMDGFPVAKSLSEQPDL
jgi:hypothetical protein